MKKMFITMFLTTYISVFNLAISQNNAINQSIDSINAVLKENPYHDGFNDISFFYSVNITPDNELIVEMSFDGPFKWIYKVKISDLDLAPGRDICRESPNSICWTCKQSDPGQPVSCIQAEMIMTDGGSTIQNSSNICVSFSGRNRICSDLNKKFMYLFNSVNNSYL